MAHDDGDLLGMPEEFLLCRDKKHHWIDSNAIEQKKDRLLRIIERCDSCGGERVTLMNLRTNKIGHIVDRWISKYPEGYLMPKGTGRLDVDDRGKMRAHRYGYH